MQRKEENSVHYYGSLDHFTEEFQGVHLLQTERRISFRSIISNVSPTVNHIFTKIGE
jgi:hypothetical protein